MISNSFEEKKLSKYHTVSMDQDYLNNIRVTISLQKQGRRNVTQIIGLDNKKFDLKSITTKLKKTCGGGGTCKEIDDEDENIKSQYVIGIQGDCRIIARDFLIQKLLLSETNIRVMGV